MSLISSSDVLMFFTVQLPFKLNSKSLLHFEAQCFCCVCVCGFPAGVIDFLVSQHPIAQVLRDHVVFKIVPMLNPDGVYLGNYRSAETIDFCAYCVWSNWRLAIDLLENNAQLRW